MISAFAWSWFLTGQAGAHEYLYLAVREESSLAMREMLALQGALQAWKGRL